MPRNEQIIRTLDTEHLDTDEDRGDHHGMHAIDADAVKREPVARKERGWRPCFGVL